MSGMRSARRRMRGPWISRWEPDLLGGVVVLDGPAFVRDDRVWDLHPYREVGTAGPPNLEPVRVRAIPYYAWANRGRYSMVTALALADSGPPAQKHRGKSNSYHLSARER